MHELAWRCSRRSMANRVVSNLRLDITAKQCKYKYILHLPGISDWLEHFKHQLACGENQHLLRPTTA